MDGLSLFISVVGVGLAIVALTTAQNVRNTVQGMVRRANDQTDADTVKTAIDKVLLAKEAAKRRHPNAPSELSLGHELSADIALVIEAEDALRTGLPPAVPPTLNNSSNNAAGDLVAALLVINVPVVGRDGWADAYSTLQTIVPELEREHRRLKNNTLTTQA